MVVIGRPKGSGTKKTTKKQPKETQYKTCLSCPPDKATKPVSQFYKSFNPLHADGLVPICKDCIVNQSYNKETNDVDIESFKSVLRQIDKAFIESIFQSSINQYNDTYAGKRVKKDNRKVIVSYYFKNVNTLRQYRTLNWQQGIEWNQTHPIKDGGLLLKNIESTYEQKPNKTDEPIYLIDEKDDFVVTKDIVRLFGNGYRKSEYKAMWEKYDFLRKNYPDVTNLHVEALVTYVRFKVKEEIATAQGNASDAEKWSQAAMKAADKAKINPSQLSQSDLQGGLNSFSELLQAVEQAVDIIPILPQFKFRPNDAIDFNIWCLINYLRDLEGKPLCEYKDVYQFYDDRKKEYIEQYGDPYGIFEGDTTESNRENIEKFITLPNDYEEIETSDEQDE